MLIWVPEEAVLEFGGSKAFRKQPVCTKGWGPCGYACLPHTKKNCKAALDGQVKSLAEWLEKSAKAETKKSGPVFEIFESDPSTGDLTVSTQSGDRTAYINLRSPGYTDHAAILGSSSIGLNSAIAGLTLNANHVVRVGSINTGGTGFLMPDEEATLLKQAIAQYSKDGDLIVISGEGDFFGQVGADHPITKNLLRIESDSDAIFSAVGYAGMVKNGQLVALSDDIQSRRGLVREVREMRRHQFQAVTTEFVWRRAFDDDEIVAKTLKKAWKDEDETAAKLGKVEDLAVGRQPKKGVVKSVSYYKKKANEWAKSQGLGDSANGFTSAATKAHDLGHPITHEMIGMDSAAINKALGGLTQKDGKASLVAEEAIVNVVEHLSRGDSLEASILNGVRLARVLSRNTQYETDEAREYVRSKEFKDKVVELADQIYRNDNFTEYMKLVRQANRVSKTVTAAGDDFTNSASGG